MRLIDADEAYKIITEYYHHRTDMQHTALKEALDKVPTIEPAPTAFIPGFTITSTDGQAEVRLAPIIHGRWIGKPIAGYSTVRCSVCRSVFSENNGKWNYCPDCGAKMDEVEE